MCVFRVEHPQCKVIMTGWKGVVTARTFLPFSDIVHYTRLCGEEFKSRGKFTVVETHLFTTQAESSFHQK